MKLFFTLGLLIALLTPAGFIFAQASSDQPAEAATSDCPSGSKSGTTCLKNPLRNDAGESVTDIPTLIGTVIKVVLSVLGSIALLMMVRGGVKWLTSGGNAESVKSGRDTMLWAALGVFLVLASYFLVETYLKFLVDAQ